MATDQHTELMRDAWARNLMELTGVCAELWAQLEDVSDDPASAAARITELMPDAERRIDALRSHLSHAANLAALASANR